jgi:site-specific DNA recombinase
MKQLEEYQPIGDEDIDTEWRTTLQRRFAQIAAERRATSQRLAGLGQQKPQRRSGDPALLDLLPQGVIDPTLLPEEDQRDLYDAFHLQIRYDPTKHQVTLRVTIYAEAITALTEKIQAAEKVEPHKKVQNDETSRVAAVPATRPRSLAVGAPGGIRTHTVGGLSSASLPVGIRGPLPRTEYPLR